MASLIIQSSDPIQAACFGRRVLIGRKPFNGVQFGQRVVSRIHAWIDKNGEYFYIADAASRGGTFVNGRRITGKMALREGDEITIGSSRMTFHETDHVPDGAITFEITEQGTNPDFDDPGILLTCPCGAPMWVPAGMAGAYGKCRICQGDIIVPGVPLSGVRRPLTPNDSIVDMPAISEADLGLSARPPDPLGAEFPQPHPELADKICPICKSVILRGEVTQTCPACSQRYHAECWRANRGCAAYGCSQAGAVRDDSPDAFAVPTAATQAVVAIASIAALAPAPKPEPQPLGWDAALLGLGVLASALGAFTFGVPSLVVGIAAAVHVLRRRDGRHHLAALSALICLLGVALGEIVSIWLWFGVPLWRIW